MTNYLNFSDARFSLAHELNQAIADRLKELLESKHLYQNVVIDFPALFQKFINQLLLDNEKFALRKFAAEDCSMDFVPSEHEAYLIDRGVNRWPVPTLFVQNVKLYCSYCKQRETFSPTLYIDTTKAVAERHKEFPRTVVHPAHFQLFVLVYQCEICKKVPVGFLVRRQAWKLTLEGRTPFEEVDVPNFIPKTERWLFSEAIVAAQTGNTLAGLFYLRAFIEQFARRQTGIQERRTGEEILDAYQSLLPEKQRDHMPSLRSWYEKLSGPIHSAKPDMALFEEAKSEIVTHFDFRRLYKIPDIAPTEVADGKSATTSGKPVSLWGLAHVAQLRADFGMNSPGCNG